MGLKLRAHGAFRAIYALAIPQYYSVCPVDVLQLNTIGNYNLLQLAKEKQVKGYLLFSTGDVYRAVNVASRLISEETFGAMNTPDIHNCYSTSENNRYRQKK